MFVYLLLLIYGCSVERELCHTQEKCIKDFLICVRLARVLSFTYMCVCAVQIKYPFGYVYLYLYVYYWNSDLRSQVCFVEMVYICALIALAQSPHDVSHKLRAFISNMCVFNIYIKICFSSVYIHISCSILKQSVPCSELDQNIFHFAYI